MPEKDRSDFIYRKMLSAVFDTIAYKITPQTTPA